MQTHLRQAAEKMATLNRDRFKSKFDGDVNDQRRLLWLQGITTPAAAIGEALRQLKRIELAEAYYQVSLDFSVGGYR